jgi:hypothetical protein
MAEAAAAKKASGLVAKQQVSRTKNAKPGKTRQLLALVVLVACCAASFIFYQRTMTLVESSSQVESQPDTTPNPDVLNEAKEIQQVTGELEGVGKASNSSMQTALMAEVHGKYPVGAATSLTPPPPPTPPIEEEVYEPDPPQVTVMAVMVTEGDSVAMINVLGPDGEDGLIVRRGSKFSNGSARITKIDSKGVTFTWMKKTYQAGVER